MGLGKTVQAVVALDILVKTGQVSRALVVVPSFLKLNWEREVRRWPPELSVRRVAGSEATVPPTLKRAFLSSWVILVSKSVVLPLFDKVAAVALARPVYLPGEGGYPHRCEESISSAFRTEGDVWQSG
jgi:SNF2 family DNA or RNA helicase